MYYELYIDVLFLVNFLMDYLLLLITRKVLRCRGSYGRICLGAALGACLTCLITVVQIPYAFIKVILFHILVTAVMLVTGLSVHGIRNLVKGAVTLYISSFLVGGVFSFLNQYVQIGSLFFAFAIVSYYLASGALKMLGWLFRFGECHYQVILYLGEKKCEAEAILDTGNRLTDQVTGSAVSIISRRTAEKLLGKEIPENFRYIPYRTIGNQKGVIPVMTVDRIKVTGKEEQWFESPLIGISGDPSFGKEYDMILNPDI